MTKRGKVIFLILFGGAILAVLFGGLLAYSLYFSNSPKITKNSVLELRLAGEFIESAPPDTTFPLLARSPETFKSVLDNIQKAKTDGKIKGMLLLINDPSIGQAKVDELRATLLDFKTSGKPIFAYMERADDLEYYLATAADKIYVCPSGDVSVKGFAAQAMFLRGLFDKLKIEPNIERHGKYKSFGDLYTRENMSDAQREEVSALLDDYYQRYTETIAKARQKSPEEIRQLIDQGPYSNAKKATEAGLIDGALYSDEVKDQLKQQLKLDKYEGVNSSKYGNADSSSFGSSRDKIAVIYAAGTITSGKSGKDPVNGRTVGSDTIVAAIRKAREDHDIKAIILRVDSPGGSGLASDVIWREVTLAKKEKPFVVSMSDLAASGGYYISMAADKIVAEPGTLTGSIGVVSGKFNINGLIHDHLGITVETITRGRNADINSAFQNFSEEQRTKFHQDMMDFYYQFVAKAAEGRKMSTEQLDAIAQGRVWTGAQGKERGLVDELGGLSKAVEIAKELAKIPADHTPQLLEYPKPPGLWESLFGEKDDDMVDSRETAEQAAIQRVISESVPADLRATVRTLAMLKNLERERVLAFMPYLITIR
jgi:protease IV